MITTMFDLTSNVLLMTEKNNQKIFFEKKVVQLLLDNVRNSSTYKFRLLAVFSEDSMLFYRYV